MTKPTCSDCWNFYRFPNSDGECRRYPPRISEAGESGFPEVSYEDWCGEFFHKDRDKANAKAS